MHANLTTAFLETVVPTARKEREYFWDKELAALGVLVRTGKRRTTKRWVVDSAAPRQFGTYPEMTVAAARAKVEEWVKTGADPRPAPAETSRKAKVEDARGALFKDVVPGFHSDEGPRWADKTKQGHCRRLSAAYFGELYHKHLNEIGTGDVTEQLKTIVAEHSYNEARYAKWSLMELYAYAIAHGLAKYNPAAGAKVYGKPEAAGESKGQVIPPKILGEWWLAAADEGDYGRALHLAILYGGRISEATDMTGSELEGDIWTIPAERYKTDVDHSLPLTKMALDALAGVTRETGRLFRISNPRRSGRKLMARLKAKGTDVSGFRPHHDFRHTFRTVAVNLPELKAAWPSLEERQMMVDLAIHPKKKAKHDRHGYDKNKHLAEKRIVFEAWANYLSRLTGGNVVELRAAVMA